MGAETAKAPRSPAGLSKAGKALWKSLASQVVFEPWELRSLEDACRLADDILKLELIAADSPGMVSGERGNVKLDPVFEQLRRNRATMTQLLKAAGLPPERSQHRTVSQQARASASVRWSGPGSA